MNIQSAYNNWANQYDNNKNRTRDLEAISLQATLKNIAIENCLEIGCGTGKNTGWLLQKAGTVTAVDFSQKMIAKAKQKFASDNVKFIQHDITTDWNFTSEQFDVITFSLVLEHILELDPIFRNASRLTKNGSYLYVGELHPFKQYTGTKARFETESGIQEVICYTHHISEFLDVAKENNFELISLNEYFDENDKTTIPRILTLLFKKTI